MTVAFGQFQVTVPHELFEVKRIDAFTSQPGGEGVPQGVKDHLVPGILDVSIESELDDQFSKTVGQGAAFLSALRWRQDQTARDAAYITGCTALPARGVNQAFPKHHLHVGIVGGDGGALGAVLRELLDMSWATMAPAAARHGDQVRPC